MIRSILSPVGKDGGLGHRPGSRGTTHARGLREEGTLLNLWKIIFILSSEPLFTIGHNLIKLVGLYPTNHVNQRI